MSAFNEIGGNFWIKPEQLNLTNNNIFNLKFINTPTSTFYTSSGRGAINLLLKNINPTSRIALLPNYTCQSVINPFIYNSYKLEFYEINNDLSINLNIMSRLIETFQSGVILFQSYFGFDTLKNIRPFYKQMKEKDNIIIEDITHSWLSSYDKDGADFYICSLRKWLELPDGGVLITNTNNHNIKRSDDSQNQEIVKLFLEASHLKHQYSQNTSSYLKPIYRGLFYEVEDKLDKDYYPYSMSNLSKNILNNSNFNQLSDQRKRNYKYLLNNLNLNNNLKLVFDDLSEEIVPLYFPLYVSHNRDYLQSVLAQNEIYAPIHWPIPYDADGGEIVNKKYIYNNILSIPCDQRYNEKHMSKIVTTLNTIANHL